MLENRSKEGFKRNLVVDIIRLMLFLSFLKQMEMPFRFINGPSSLPCLFLSDPGGSSAQVLLSSGQVVSWKNEQGEELLFKSNKVSISYVAYVVCGLAIKGPDFRNKSPDELKAIVPYIQVMARSLPLDKHKLVTNLRSMHKEVVAVTGDGTNDAPALHEADIGLATGIDRTEVAKENVDVIILDDNFSTIVNVAKWGRTVYINIQKFVQFHLIVNIVALMINFISACVSGSAPFTAVQLLWVNLIMDTLGALALATEPPHDGLMNRSPVGMGVSFITRAMWRNIAGQSIYQMVLLFVFNFAGKQILGLNGSDATIILNTFIFNTFVGDTKV
ncbi:Calcium ATPase [Heracleum sosnowskyi]|uniref:Calcium ATPase n=1 Tax=Heracleum sosnowskyi TaxID=360622 RepID=A0AAD8HQJ7_9APIA|nr:Calcium ATPase [Heracleum sosnowskyi]